VVVEEYNLSPERVEHLAIIGKSLFNDTGSVLFFA
jgi:hypothetical protein